MERERNPGSPVGSLPPHCPPIGSGVHAGCTLFTAPSSSCERASIHPCGGRARQRSQAILTACRLDRKDRLRFSCTPFEPRLYSPHPFPEGALSRPPGSRGKGTAPAPVGARQAANRPAGQWPRSSRGCPSPPLRHYDRSAPGGLKKCGMETFRRRVGAPVRRHFLSSAKPALPHPSSRPGPQCPGDGIAMGVPRAAGGLVQQA
jgi:hypothetical protein